MKSQLLLVFALLIASTSAHLYIRVAHAAVKAPAVDIAANGTIIVSNLGYPTVTDYLKVNAGEYTLEVLVHGTNTTVFKVSTTLDNSKSYTFVATGDPAVNESFTVVAIEDDKTNPADGYTSRVRAFHGVADISEAQILVNGNIVAELNYKQTTPYLVLAQGSYHVALHRKVGNFSGEVYSTQLNVVGGTVYTVFAEGLYNDSGVNNIAFAVKADAVYNYLVGRAAHASPNSPNVDVYVYDLVDGGTTKVAADLKFNGFSAYTLIAFEPTKNYSVVLTMVNEPNAILYAIQPIFQPMVVTAAILGLHSNATTTPLHIQFFTDANNAPTDPTTASIKFIHAIPGALPASLVSGTQVLFPQIPYDTTSEYMAVSAGQTTFHVVVNGSTILTKDFDLVAGSVYSFYAEGEVATASLQISSDASFTYTNVRVSHAAPEAPNVDVVFKDVLGNTISTFSDVSFGKTTGYTLLVIQNMTVNLVVGGNTIFTDSVTFTKDTQNTLVVFGTPNTNFTDGLATKVFQDDNTYPATSQLSSVRFVHAVVGGPHVDVHINGAPLFTNVAYQEATAYKHDVAEGTYTVTVSSGNLTVISFTQYFVGGAVYTIFAEGEVGPHSKVPAHQVVNQDETYNYTTIRVAHASYDAPAVDITFTDGVNTIVFAKNVVFGFISEYQEIVLFDYNLMVAPTGTTDYKLNQPIKLTRDSINTVAVIGLLKSNTTTSLEGVVYIDDRTDPSNSDISRGRFVHAVADGAPNVDVYFNDQIQFQNIAYGTATPYKDLEVQTYRVDIYAAGTHSKPLSSKTWTLTGGQVFSLFAEGVPTNIEQKSFNDFAVTFYRVRVAHASPDAGEVQVLVEGEAVWSNVAFQQITAFQEFTSDKKNISIVSGGHIVLQTNAGFPANEDTTLLIVGLTKGNNTTPLELVAVSDKTTVPSSTTVSSVRVAFTTPDAPLVDLLFNGTAQFTQLAYKTTTPYKEIPAGDYVLEVNTTLGHIKTNVLLKGGVTYTLFFEGLFPNAVILPEVDYFPPTDARVRFLHASPDTGAVDLLVNGSADIRDVTFSKMSDYVLTNAGENTFGIVATGTLLPNLYSTTKHLEQSMDYSLIFVGLSNKNATTVLEAIIATDDNALPAEGQLKIRFVHASPNAPAIDIRANSVPLFSNISYQEVSKYVTTEAAFYDLDILLAGKTDVVFSSRLDLRVASGSAVYTLVAEGLVQQEPALTVVAYLDNGVAPPSVHSSSRHHGLSGVAIGLIIGGVAVGVIILAAAGFVFYKKRKERIGYSEIPSKE